MSNEDEDALIPCELCNEMIRFSNFDRHVRICAAQHQNSSAPHFIIYRDDDDNTFYRIDISPAYRMFQRMQMQSGSNADTESSETDSGDEEARYLPTRTTHSTLMVVPRLIPIIDSALTQYDGSYEINNLLAEAVGRVHIGLTNPEQYITASTAAEVANATSEDVCPICQDALEALDWVKTRCKHSYCRPCILKWFADHTTCPVCNSDQRELSEKID